MRSPMAPPQKKSVQYLRNFVMAKLIIANGQRPGAVVSLRLSDFREMKAVDNREGFYYMLNINHKTSKTHGPAVIILDDELRDMLRAYVRYRLPQSAVERRSSDQPLFIARNETTDRKVPPRTITLRVVTDFLNVKCLGIHQSSAEKRVTFTQARKRVVTESCLDRRGTNETLAMHMSHSIAAQQTFYRLDQLEEHVDAFLAIRGCLATKNAKKQNKCTKTTNSKTNSRDKSKKRNCRNNSKTKTNSRDNSKKRNCRNNSKKKNCHISLVGRSENAMNMNSTRRKRNH